MKQEISEQETRFIRDGFHKNFRADGRANTDVQRFAVSLGSIEEAYGSATVTFGEADTQIICAIKAEIQKPLVCEPNKGQVTFHLESSQTGTSLFTHEQDADMTKQRLLHILSTLYTNTVVDREELVIFKAEYVWQLHVDVLVMDELSLNQLDMIGASIRAAFQNLRLPQVIATLNANSNKIEVGLVEEIYPDKANTDTQI